MHKDVLLDRLKNTRNEIRSLKQLQKDQGDVDSTIAMDIQLYEDIVKECYEQLKSMKAKTEIGITL